MSKFVEFLLLTFLQDGYEEILSDEEVCILYVYVCVCVMSIIEHLTAASASLVFKPEDRFCLTEWVLHVTQPSFEKNFLEILKWKVGALGYFT